MLNETQKLTIRIAVGKATDKGAEIKKLAKGFPAPEGEIRAYWESLPHEDSDPQKAQSAQQPEKPPVEHKRLVWTDEMLKQLTQLHSEGKGPAAIARIMGLVPIQISQKLKQISDKASSTVTQPSKEKDSETCPLVIHVDGAKVGEALKDRSPMLLQSVPKSEVISISSTFDLMEGLLNITHHLKSEFQASIVFIQSRPSAGWGSIRFKVGNEVYSIGLRKARERKRKKA